MNFNKIYFLPCLFFASCSSGVLITVLDENNAPIQGVAPVPQYLFGGNHDHSNKNGEMKIDPDNTFYLIKQGYEDILLGDFTNGFDPFEIKSVYQMRRASP